MARGARRDRPEAPGGRAGLLAADARPDVARRDRRVIERILGLVAAARIDGSWGRMKACADHGCRWVFYDHSRNRSRTWCTTNLCGSQAKMRAYRSRRASRPPR